MRKEREERLSEEREGQEIERSGNKREGLTSGKGLTSIQEAWR